MLTEQTPATRFELSHRSAQIDQVCGPQPASAAKPLAAPSVRSVMRLVDTPDSIPQFVDQVADQIRQWSASIDGFSAGEFVAALGDVVIAEAEQETSYSKAAISGMEKAVQQAPAQERASLETALEMVLDTSSKRIKLAGIQITALQRLMSEFGVSSD
jgi:hypothetical protein